MAADSTNQGATDIRYSRFALSDRVSPHHPTPTATAAIRRQDFPQCESVHSLVATSNRTAERRAECAVGHDNDVGFGAPSTFGGVIPTPNMDRIAKLGLRY